MEKFRGMTRCSTRNFGGNPKAEHAALARDSTALKILFRRMFATEPNTMKSFIER